MTNELVEKIVKCPPCDGIGWLFEPGDDPKTLTFCELCRSHGTLKVSSDMKICGKCSGKGRVIAIQRTRMGNQKVLIQCDRCKGKCIVKIKPKDKEDEGVQTTA